MCFHAYLADEDASDDGQLVQRPQRSSKGRGRDLTDIHGHESRGEPCTKHTWVSPLLDSSATSRNHFPNGRGGWSLCAVPHTPPSPSCLAGNHLCLGKVLGCPCIQSPKLGNLLTDTHIRAQSRDCLLGEVITGQRTFLKLALTPQSGVVCLHTSNSIKSCYF